MFLSKLIDVATFEILPEEYVDLYTDYPEAQAFNDKMEQTKYESIFPLQNMATDFLFFKIFIAMNLIYLLSCILFNRIKRVQKMKNSLEESLFWTIPLRYLIEGYLELLICATIGFLSMQWDFITPSIMVSNILSITLALILIVFPIILICIYPCNYSKLENEKYKQKYGEMYADLRLKNEGKNNRVIVSWPFVFITKRMVFVFSCIFLREHISLQA